MLPAGLKPYTHPRMLSVVAPGGRLLPSRSHGVEALTEGVDGQAGVGLNWTPWGAASRDPLGPVLSSGPQRGQPARHAIGTAYVTPPNLWNLAGVQNGWSSLQGGGATPARQPTTKLAIGRGWLTMPAGSAPTPSLPEPARMVTPMRLGR